MTTSTHSRSPRGGSRRPSRSRRSRQRQQPSWLVRITVAAVAVAALAAVTVTLLAGDATSEATPFDTASAQVDGGSLVPRPETGTDPAVGETAPRIEGRDRDDQAVQAPMPGRPTVLLFLAHWCPHCRREVPRIQEWADAGELPAAVDIVAVSTAVDPSRPNHPASAWLDREQWTLSTVADADGTAATAYGVSGFPFWVAVDAQGEVVERRVGELTLDQLRDLAQAATS